MKNPWREIYKPAKPIEKIDEPNTCPECLQHKLESQAVCEICAKVNNYVNYNSNDSEV